MLCISLALGINNCLSQTICSSIGKDKATVKGAHLRSHGDRSFFRRNEIWKEDEERVSFLV
jgi:hypothetical protein